MSAVLEVREPSTRCLDAIEPKLVQQFDLLVGASAGVTRLRELILALAMRGKLVPQDSTDKSAAQLVMRLMTERGASTLRRRTATSTGVLQAGQASDSLPSSWAVASLSAISVKLTDGSHNPPRDAGSGIPMLSSQNVLDSGTIDFDSPTRYVSIDDFERENARTNATPGDVLLTIVASLGRSAVVPVDAPAFVLQRSVAVIRTGLDPAYLAMFLRSPGARAYYDEHGKGTAQKGIYLGKLGELTLPIPPLAEQARIVTRVEELMRLCDALEAKGRLEAEQHARLLGTLLGTLTDSSTPEELAANWQRVADHFDLLLDRPEAVDALEQTILQLAVRGLLVPQHPSEEPARMLLQAVDETKGMLIASGSLKIGKPPPAISADEQLFDLPDGWSWERIDRLATVQGGIQKTPLRRPVRNHAPYLRVANVQRDALDLKEIEHFEVSADEVERWRLHAGDLLVVEGNGSEHEIGRCALWTGSIDPCVYQNHLIRVRCLHPTLVAFIQLFLNSPDGKAEMKRLAITTSGLFNLSVGKIRHYAVPVPPVAEQARIVARVTELRRLCADLRQRLSAVRTTQSHLAEALVDSAAA